MNSYIVVKGDNDNDDKDLVKLDLEIKDKIMEVLVNQGHETAVGIRLGLIDFFIIKKTKENLFKTIRGEIYFANEIIKIAKQKYRFFSQININMENG